MDLLQNNFTTNSPLTPVFGDNVQDLLGIGALQINPSAIITVNSIADEVGGDNGVTTLRDAINSANADAGEDLIVFERSLFTTAQTITLNLGELDITHNVSIIAPKDSLTGGDLVTISGNNASRVFEIEAGATVNFSGLIVESGKVTGDNGGGILNSGTLSLDSTIIRNNSADLVGGAEARIIGSGGGISNSGSVNVSNSTISGNSVSLSGGGIDNSGIVNVNNSTISGNTARGGGGISNSGTVVVNNSTLSDNSGDRAGGGIYNSGTDAILSVSNSTLMGNKTNIFGGGIDSDGTTLTVSNSTLSDNSAEYGGGINNRGSKSIEVSNSTLSGNSAYLSGGGILGNVNVSNSIITNNSTTTYISLGDGGGGINGGNVSVSNSIISGNSTAQFGGGIYGGNIQVSNSTISGNSTAQYGGGIYGGNIQVSNSTISDNSAGNDGGGICNTGTSTVSNSTISGNSALNDGGGIYNSYTGILTLVFSTLTLNQAANGGGVYQDNVPPVGPPFGSPYGPQSPGFASVRNTIIAANIKSADGVNPDVSGNFTSNGYNLIGDSTGSTGFDATGDIVGTSDNPIDPRLAILDFNGGSTQTIALLPDSPAIDAGDPTLLDTDPTTDQRGFPRVSGGTADIGAFEFS